MSREHAETPRARILLVDDDPRLLQLVGIRLRAAGYAVDTAPSGEAALAQLSARRPDLVVTDLRMDGMDGMALLEHLRRELPTVPAVILTAHGTIPEAVAATRQGAFDFLTKPCDAKRLLEVAARALALSAAGHDGDPGSVDGAWCRDIVTRNAGMRDLLVEARMAARSEANVFIRGASGTGKELLARAVHRASERAGMPFTAVNCSAIPEPLLESELFGHSKGSFSGAVSNHRGLFRAAHGGTLFLDEVGDMPLALQAKVLRAIQERRVRPVGSTEAVDVDVRIVAATHRDLERAMDEGAFREDLYYRLHVVELRLPPLAERRDDIALLARHFLDKLAARARKDLQGFAPEALELLVRAPWPGNVRQLFNVIEQAVVLTAGPVIPAALVGKALRSAERAGFHSLNEARRDFERRYLTGLLKATAGNVAKSAALAQRNRTDFYRLLQRHSLDPAAFKDVESEAD